MSVLKEFVGDELDAQIDKALEGKDEQIKLANLAGGQYVDKGKYDRALTDLNKLKNPPKPAKPSGKESKADDQTQAALDAANDMKKQYTIGLNRLKAEKVLAGAGLKEEDYSDLLESLVTEDEDSTVTHAKSLAKLLSKQTKATEAKVKADLLKGTPGPAGSPSPKDDKPGSFGAELAKSVAGSIKKSNDAYTALIK